MERINPEKMMPGQEPGESSKEDSEEEGGTKEAEENVNTEKTGSDKMAEELQEKADKEWGEKREAVGDKKIDKDAYKNARLQWAQKVEAGENGDKELGVMEDLLKKLKESGLSSRAIEKINEEVAKEISHKNEKERREAGSQEMADRLQRITAEGGDKETEMSVAEKEIKEESIKELESCILEEEGKKGLEPGEIRDLDEKTEAKCKETAELVIEKVFKSIKGGEDLDIESVASEVADMRVPKEKAPVYVRAAEIIIKNKIEGEK